MRKEFLMTDEQFNELIEACRPVSYMVFNGVIPKSPEEKANEFWSKLGKELKFDYLTVRPVHGKDARYFTAETSK